MTEKSWETKDINQAGGQRRLSRHYNGKKPRALYFRNEREFGRLLLHSRALENLLYRKAQYIKYRLAVKIPLGSGREKGHLRHSFYVEVQNPGGVKKDRVAVKIKSKDPKGFYYGDLHSAKHKPARWTHKTLRESRT